MAETPNGTGKGLDTVNETISVKGLTFSSQLGIGSAKWLEFKTGKPLFIVMQDFVKATGPELEITKIALLLTALYLQAHPRTDPAEAEAAVDGLAFSEMMEVLSRSRPFEFEPKNSPVGKTEMEASTGQPSSTT
jgi:hypothetical protein